METAEFDNPQQLYSVVQLLLLTSAAQSSADAAVARRVTTEMNGSTGLISYLSDEDNFLIKTIPGDGTTLVEVYILALSDETSLRTGIPDNIQFFTTFID